MPSDPVFNYFCAKGRKHFISLAIKNDDEDEEKTERNMLVLQSEVGEMKWMN